MEIDPEKEKQQKLSDIVRAEINLKNIHKIFGVCLNRIYRKMDVLNRNQSRGINQKRKLDYINSLKKKKKKGVQWKQQHNMCRMDVYVKVILRICIIMHVQNYNG